VNCATIAPSRLAAGFRLRIWDDNCLFEASSRNWSLHSVADDFVIAQLATHHFIPFTMRQLTALHKKSEQERYPSLLA
jgi:hypothetical protein